MKPAKSALILLALAALAGCGPEKSELDLEREKAKQRLDQKAGEIAVVEGSYSGAAFLNGQEVTKFELNIQKIFVENPANPDSPELKIIAAATLLDGTGQVIPISLPSVKFYPQQNLLVMVGKFLLTSGGEAYINLSGNGPGSFVGKLYSSQFLPIANVRTMSLDLVLSRPN